MICTSPTPDADVLADALDCLGAALFLVDRISRIVHANADARQLLRVRTVLREAGGRLTARQPDAARALERSIAEAGSGAAVRMALPLRAEDGEHCIAHVLPLCGAQRRAGAGGDAIAAVLVHKVALALSHLPETVAGLYGLTPGEARVLVAIVEVGGVRETAEALGLSEATVKTHLHRLFGKTGAARQADLVKLVAGLGNPMVGPVVREPDASAAASPSAGWTRPKPAVRALGAIDAACPRRLADPALPALQG
jgi:DNA-binding CsgD family transcriptional regulator